MGLIVEVMGLPGAGKSTFTAVLERELLDRGIPAQLVTRGVDHGTPPSRRYTAKLLLVLSQLVRRPRPSIQALRLVMASRQTGPAAVAHRAVAWLVAQTLAARGRQIPGIVILDEGPLQCLWSIGLLGDHRAMLEAWRARPGQWVLGDVVVVLQPPLTVVGARLHQRPDPHSRIETAAGTARDELLRHGEAVLRQIADAAAGLGLPPERVIRLDAGPGTSLLEALAAMTSRR